MASIAWGAERSAAPEQVRGGRRRRRVDGGEAPERRRPGAARARAAVVELARAYAWAHVLGR